MPPSNNEIRANIITTLASRKPGSTICPSEVARNLGSQAKWRELMPAVREVTAILVQEEIIAVTQKGKTIDITKAKGPIRLDRGSKWVQP